MKKITLLIIAVTTIATSQLKVGINPFNIYSLEGAATAMEGMGFSVGYEKMFMGLVGAGAEYTLSGTEQDGDENPYGIPDFLFAYSVVRIPIGTMLRAVAKFGLNMPMGSVYDGETASDWYDPTLSYGGGLRFKLPLFPVGLEALYTIHNMKEKEFDSEQKYSMVSINATYSF